MYFRKKHTREHNRSKQVDISVSDVDSIGAFFATLQVKAKPIEISGNELIDFNDIQITIK